MALLKLSLSFLALKISNLPIWPPIQFSIPCMAFPSVMFASNWPAPAPGSSKPQGPVLTAMLRSFWPQFLLTAVLGVARGPVRRIRATRRGAHGGAAARRCPPRRQGGRDAGVAPLRVLGPEAGKGAGRRTPRERGEGISQFLKESKYYELLEGFFPSF